MDSGSGVEWSTIPEDKGRDVMRRPEWSEIVLNASIEEADMLLETFNRYTVTRSNAVSCIICNNVKPHSMRYRILECGSVSCTRVLPGLNFPWSGRTLECMKTGEVTIHEFSSHVSPISDSRRDFLTVAHKAYIAEMAALRLKPSRIRNSMTRRFDIVVEDLPPLVKVQNYANFTTARRSS